ncbi:MAG: hypothetical protein Kow0013_21570 [Pararhodobacter sp.]
MPGSVLLRAALSVIPADAQTVSPNPPEVFAAPIRPPLDDGCAPLQRRLACARVDLLVKFRGEGLMSLLETARAVREHAYAPYSRFKVGAAIRAESGAVYAGCNVENVAYPQGTCAEAGAIAAMVAGGDTRIAEVCVIADSPNPVPPCGGCRQKLREFAGGDVRVTMATTDGKTLVMTMDQLLPGAFAASHMERR